MKINNVQNWLCHLPSLSILRAHAAWKYEAEYRERSLAGKSSHLDGTRAEHLEAKLLEAAAQKCCLKQELCCCSLRVCLNYSDAGTSGSAADTCRSFGLQVHSVPTGHSLAARTNITEAGPWKKKRTKQTCVQTDVVDFTINAVESVLVGDFSS